ncbi:PQQ-binding-like beta-propeller repeat protein [Isoptericola sp. NPDC057653]|uniref:outer membrane protein assembly factor BamB family protein n=1 Tax=Isoptericola sp. NPDC057653 TaxID=3346195 RepID=UPI0036C349E7
MPPRFRRHEPMSTFELVPDDEREDDGRPGPAGDDAPDAAPLRHRAAERWRGLSRRGRVLVAGSAAVVVVAVAAAAVVPGMLEARAERLRADAARGLPGVVTDLTEPLAETWKVAAGEGGVAVLADGVLLTSEGTVLTGIDSGTGTEIWQQDVGENPTCAPGQTFGPRGALPAERVVCFGGPDRSRVVTVLDAAGTVVGTRDLDGVGDPLVGVASTEPQAWPAADGTIAVVAPLTAVTVPKPDDDSPDALVRALRGAGWTDPTLRLEDALTGETVAEATVRLRNDQLEGCERYEEHDGKVTVEAVPWVDTSATWTNLYVCGGGVSVAADGAVRDLATAGGAPETLPGGGTVVPGESSSTYYDAAGDEVATVPGWPLPPPVDTDPDGAFLSLEGPAQDEAGLGVDSGAATRDGGSGLRLTASGRDGSALWSVPTEGFPSVAARVAGTVVVTDDARVFAVDAATGAERWSLDDTLERDDQGVGEQVDGVVTDGTRVLLAISDETGSDPRLLALDARDGRTVWQADLRGNLGTLVAVDGHVVMISGTGTGARGLG